MDESGEARTSVMAASNGLSRRRSRSSVVVRENLDDGHAARQYRSNLIDHLEKRDRDFNSLNRTKRRRSDRISQKNERDEEGEDSSDDSLLAADEIPQARMLKDADEMIGVPVPRKARSACVKRSHDCRTSSASASPASQSFEAGSPSSSNISVKQRMMFNGSNIRNAKQSLKSSVSAQNDLEIEIAEVLSGLKQSQSTKKEDEADKCVKSFEPKDVTTKTHDANPSLIDSMKMKMKCESSLLMKNKLEARCPEEMKVSASKAGETEKSPIEMKQENPNLLLNEGPFLRDGSTATKGRLEGSEFKSKKEENCNKFKIDLMAPPFNSMPSSPHRDAFVPSASDSKPMTQKSNMKEIHFRDEKVAIEASQEKKENGEWLKLDLEMRMQNDRKNCSLNLLNQSQMQPHEQQIAKAVVPKAENTPQPNSVQLFNVVCKEANGQQSFGNVPPPFQTNKPMAGSTGCFPATKSTQFITYQPRPKRCATHYYIARSIQLNQQVEKTNSSSAASGCPIQSNLYAVPPPAKQLLYGNSSPLTFPVLSLNSSQAKEQICTNIPPPKDKASDSGNELMDTSQKKQVVNQHTPQGSPVLQLPGPGFIFPVTHHRQQVAATINQPTPSKSVASTKISSLADNSAYLSFDFQSSTVSEAPSYLTMHPNNGYPFPTPCQSTVKNGSSAHAIPLFNGSFYSSHVSVPSQYQQQQQAHRDTSKSSGLSLSQKQPHSQVNAVQKQHLPSIHQSHKLETKTSGEKSSVVSDSWVLHPQKSTYGQTSTIPLQPFNFPMSFASSNGSGTSSNFNFASVGQNPAVVQANGYHIVAAPPQSAQQKNHLITESKNDDGKKIGMVKTPTIPSGQTLVFDNSARTLNFVSSPVIGGWPHHAITASTMPSISPVYSNLANSQQIQIQKHHALQQQTQLAGRSKLTATSTLPASSITAKFPDSISVFPQSTVHANSIANQSNQWKNSLASPSLTAGRSFNHQQYQQMQQSRAQHGETQISFSGNTTPVLLQYQGQQQTLHSSQSQPHMVSGSPSNSKANSTGSNKTGSSAPKTQSQQTDSPSAAQKSSPVCGRNVPSIISSCPSQVSELK